MRKKLIFIPGWMDRASSRGPWDDLGFWFKNINLKKKFDTEYIIGHSAGAIISLLNWKHNKNARIILVNPMFPRRKLYEWLTRYAKYFWGEKLPSSFEKIPLFFYLPFGIIRLLELIKIDTLEIIGEIPPDSLTVICGKNDAFFCDQEARDIFKKRGVKIIEIENAGHNWDKKFNTEIEKIISKK